MNCLFPRSNAHFDDLKLSDFISINKKIGKGSFG
jgi:hypothetical protein